MRPPEIGKTLSSNNNRKHPSLKRKRHSTLYGTSEAVIQPLYTGRHFLIRKEGDSNQQETKKILESKWGFRVAETADFVTEEPNENSIADADALAYNDLGITLVGVEEERVRLLQSLDTNYLTAPEKIVYVPDDILEHPEHPSTWGIKASGVIDSLYTGLGVRIAILDTGLDINHPDFSHREITSHSFVPDETIQDRHGHGTHCIGIACGDRDENSLRYGVAKQSRIFAGKVLSDQGSGAQSWVLNGITWAAKNKCQVISLSLGSSVLPGETYDIAYERAARFARSKGAVLVAAAGNESDRSQNRFSPVASPADCPSILAVAALNENLAVAGFSNREVNPSGKVDIAGPGVGIYSTWLTPERYRTLSGTSMATPHVAGIAAFLFEKSPDATPAEIEKELLRLAKPLPIGTEDVGAGLCIAP